MTDSNKQVFDTVALVGLGLIGSSLARAIRKYGLARKIVACVRPGPTADIRDGPDPCGGVVKIGPSLASCEAVRMGAGSYDLRVWLSACVIRRRTYGCGSV
jgi:hypothetical protein